MPLEESTKNLIDLSLIKRLKKDAVVLNTSRAGVLTMMPGKQSKENKFLSAVIDVFDEDRTISPYDQLENSHTPCWIPHVWDENCYGGKRSQ